MPSALITFKGDVDISRALNSLPEEMRARGIPSALRRGGRPIVRIARGHVPVDRTADPAGTLKASLGAEMRGRRGRQYLAVGARRGFARTVTRPIIISGEILGGVARKADPANYAHLVEGGHRVVVPKKGTSIRDETAILASGRSFVAARPFLRPAFAAAGPEVKHEFIQALSDFHRRFQQRQAGSTPVKL